MSTPLFNFVTVRNPRRPTESEITSGFIRYNPALGRDGELTPRVIEARSTRQPVQSLIREFRSDESHIALVSDLQRRLPTAAEWADWLAEHVEHLTWAEVDERLEGHPLDVDAAAYQLLWDNLIAYTYGGGPPETRESIIWAIRALNLVRYPVDQRQDDTNARRVAGATVLIPAESHFPLFRELASVEAEERAAEEPVAAEERAAEEPVAAEARGAQYSASAPEVPVGERLTRLVAAHTELYDAYLSAVDRARSEPPSAPVVAHVARDLTQAAPGAGEAPSPHQPFGRLDQDLYDRLSEPTRRVLDELGIELGTRTAYVIRQLEGAVSRVSAAAAREARATERVVAAGGTFWSTAPAAATHEHPREVVRRADVEYFGFFGPASPYAEPKCQIKPLGVGDFRRIEQTLCCYEPGEVAHIENTLKGEHKSRTTRHLARTEETLTVATEEEKTSERDTQTTDRFEMQQESSKVQQEDMKFELGVNVAAQYGPVKITTDTKFATSNATIESDKQAAKYGKEVTDRALERVVKKVRREQVTKTLDEFEETNLHEIDNRGEQVHTVGLYRWVEKTYEAKVVNYGKRLMFEFLIPEPAAFHLHAMIKNPAESSVMLEKPLDPRSDAASQALGLPPLRSHKDVNVGTYAVWAAAYGAQVEPLSPAVVTVGRAYHREGMNQSVQFADSKTDFKVPPGCEANFFNAVFGLHSQDQSGDRNWITVMVGRQQRFAQFGGSFSGVLSSEDDIVPINVMGRTRFYALNVEVDCLRTPAATEAWQIKTFAAILDAYEKRLDAYLTALAEAKARMGVEIQGRNPSLNRITEQLELRKGAIRLMTHCVALPSQAMKGNQTCGYPEFDCCEAVDDGAYIEFVEQAFDWLLMTYLFYPYFWGRKCNWRKIYQLDDADLVFLNFLQAGYARVVVPVRPGYEQATLRFLADGVPWNGGSVPGIDSPLYLAIDNEMREPVGTVDPSVPPWEIRVPTTLTVLQCESGCVQGTGLPCPCKERNGESGDTGDSGTGDGEGTGGGGET